MAEIRQHVILVSDTIWDLICYQAMLEDRPRGDVVRAALLSYLDIKQTAKIRAANRDTSTTDTDIHTEMED